MKRVLILCTGNSCRSQMAERIWEAIAHRLGLDWEAHSAGSDPAGHVHPLAIRALQEIDLPVGDLASKNVEVFKNDRFDLAVTVCDNAKESCPVFSNAASTLHWPFEDPADAEGTESEQFEVFCEIRDQIGRQIESYLTAVGKPGGVVFDSATQADGLTLFKMALAEDLGEPDLISGVCCTTDALVPLDRQAAAAFVSRENGIISGLELCLAAISRWAPELKLEVFIQDGQPVRQGDEIAILSGDAHRILVIERTCLNFLCRLSGIATLTSQFVKQVQGTEAKILDTRKTAPGWRRLEKYAVACGGGQNHRMGLFDAVMIKDNHLAFMRAELGEKSEAIVVAIRRAKEWIKSHANQLPHGAATELIVEVDTLQQLETVLGSSPDIVLLDNMSNEQLTEAVELRNRRAPDVLLEASGGVNLQTVSGIAGTGVDRISAGALTHSAKNFDIGLDWK